MYEKMSPKSPKKKQKSNKWNKKNLPKTRKKNNTKSEKLIESAVVDPTGRNNMTALQKPRSA